MSLTSFPGQRSSLFNLSCPDNLPDGLLQCALYGAMLGEYLETATGAECSTANVLGIPRIVHLTPLLCELHRLPVCLQVQFKVLIITFKAHSGTSIPEKPSCPNYTYLSHPVKQEGMLLIPSVKEFQLVGSMNLTCCLALWNILLPEVRQTLTLLSIL